MTVRVALAALVVMGAAALAALGAMGVWVALDHASHPC